MKYGTIIILNGTSSSGKTTLLRALQDSFEEPFLNAGIDKFIWMLPTGYLDRPLWDDVLGKATEAGQTGHALFSGMHHAIAALSRTGNNVLADHVLVEASWVNECAQLFAEMSAYLVGIRCPLEVVQQREVDRKDRTLGQAQAQFELVHAHGVYDFEVNTSEMSVEEAAARIKTYVQATPPHAFQQLRNR